MPVPDIVPFATGFAALLGTCIGVTTTVLVQRRALQHTSDEAAIQRQHDWKRHAWREDRLAIAEFARAAQAVMSHTVRLSAAIDLDAEDNVFGESLRDVTSAVESVLFHAAMLPIEVDEFVGPVLRLVESAAREANDGSPGAASKAYFEALAAFMKHSRVWLHATRPDRIGTERDVTTT